jgi:LuxR family transcriptional regulator, glucitol operon activator
MAYSASRLTAYALLSALEEDLRNAITMHLADAASTEDLLGPERNLRCRERFDAANHSVAQPRFEDLVEFLDFSDSADLLSQHKQLLPVSVAAGLAKHLDDIHKLAPVRNRVMHGRPLQFEDLAFTIDVIERLRQESSDVFAGASNALDRIEQDPSSVLGLDIPTDPAHTSHKFNNLPTPDFDETGFVGRKETLKQLTQLCFGPYPVITIVGEGGVGKTALALKAAYDLLDDEKAPFEAIVWTTCKTSILTSQDIIRIDGAIEDSLGMFKDIVHHLVGPSTDTADPIDEILAYLNEFKIFLVIDNLETVLDQRIRDFVSRLPHGSKILITSRIGLGAYEYPLKVSSMSEGDAVHLLRALAKVRGVQRLVKMPNADLVRYCKRMQFNPGWIKWFVAAAQAGKRPEEILANPQQFLDYCMSNVFEYLSDDSKRLLTVMGAVSGAQSQADLAYLVNLEPPVVQKSVQELLSTNMVNMVSVASGNTFQSLYQLSDMAAAYLRLNHPADTKLIQELNHRKQLLLLAAEEIGGLQRLDPYNVNNIKMRTKGDIVPAKLLRDALARNRIGEYAEAEKRIQVAKELAPDYFEVYRIEAFTHTLQGHDSFAKLSYESAIELEPGSPVLRYFYGGCLLRLGDVSESFAQLQKATELDPSGVEVQVESARALLYLREFARASAIIESLIAREGLSLRMRKKLRDLHFQCFQRHADHLVKSQEYTKAVTMLFDLKETVRDIPKEELDARLKARLLRVCPVIMALLRGVNPDRQRDLLFLHHWFLRQGGVLPSAVTSVNVSDGTATFRTDRGAEIVFREQDLVYPEDWSSVQTGHHVYHVPAHLLDVTSGSYAVIPFERVRSAA